MNLRKGTSQGGLRNTIQQFKYLLESVCVWKKEGEGGSSPLSPLSRDHAVKLFRFLTNAFKDFFEIGAH